MIKSSNCMSSQIKFEHHSEEIRQQSKVKLTDLLTRINEEKRWKETEIWLLV